MGFIIEMRVGGEKKKRMHTYRWRRDHDGRGKSVSTMRHLARQLPAKHREACCRESQDEHAGEARWWKRKKKL